MAITRRWQSGFESGELGELTSWNSSVSVGTSPSPYTGTYSFIVSNTGLSYGTVDFTSTNQLRMGFYYYIDAHDHTDSAFLNLGYVKLSRNKTTFKWQLKINGVTQDTSDLTYVLDTWYHVGIDIKYNDTTGWAYVYVDGVEDMTFSGNTGSSAQSNAIFGATDGSNPGGYLFDDMYIDDTTGEGSAAQVPILRFYPLDPDGNGNYSQFDGSDGNSVDNYLLVDERPASDSDYVETNVVDEFDSYTMTSKTLGSGETIQAVIPWARTQRAGTTEQIALGTRYSSTDLIGSDQDPAVATPGYLWERQTTKPGGGSWDQTSLDGFETVIKSRGTY
jgi:hypothetical protein